MSENKESNNSCINKDFDNDSPWEIYPKLDINKISKVSEHNARKEYPKTDLPSLKSSLISSGINTRPIVLDENWEVIEGNRRYNAAKDAHLKEVFVIRKKMTEIEKIQRSFMENELSVPMTEKDRKDFVITMEKKGLTLEQIASAVGRSTDSIRNWRRYGVQPDAFNTLPEEVKPTVSQKFDELSSKKQTVISRIVKNKSISNTPEAIEKLVIYGDQSTLSDLQQVSKDVKQGLFDTNTAQKMDTVITKAVDVRANSDNYILYQFRFSKELASHLNWAFLVFKDKSKDVIIEDVLLDWVSQERKKRNLVG